MFASLLSLRTSRSRWAQQVFLWCMALVHFRGVSAFLARYRSAAGPSTSTAAAANKRLSPLSQRRASSSSSLAGPLFFAQSTIFPLAGRERETARESERESNNESMCCPALRMSGACNGHSLSRAPSAAQRLRARLAQRSHTHTALSMSAATVAAVPAALNTHAHTHTQAHTHAHNKHRLGVAIMERSRFRLRATVSSSAAEVTDAALTIAAAGAVSPVVEALQSMHDEHAPFSAAAVSSLPLPLSLSSLAEHTHTDIVTDPTAVVHATHTDKERETERGREKKASWTPRDLSLVAIGLSHKSAKVEERERLAVPESDWHDVACALTAHTGIAEAAVLSTCNRFEVYLAGHDEDEVERDALHFLEERAWQAMLREKARESEKEQGNDASKPLFASKEDEERERLALRNRLNEALFVLKGDEAAAHLLRVSAGLDSLVLGEGQILAQVKKAAEHSTQRSSPAGKLVAKLLNRAVAAGKRVRCETEIAKGAVSVSSAAAQFSASKIEAETRRASLEDCVITIVGAGSMARLLLVHLQSQGVQKVKIVNRSAERVAALQSECSKLSLTHVELREEELLRTLSETDVLYTCTAAQEPIVTPSLLSAAMMQRRRESETARERGGLHIVDISVPRNVHADCASLADVFSYNVDDLQSVIDKNKEKRLAAMLEAESILSDELQSFRDWQLSQDAVETIKKLQEMAEATRQLELQKTFKKLSLSLPPEALQAVESLTKSLVKRLLDCPIKRLREGNACRVSIEKAFNLE